MREVWVCPGNRRRLNKTLQLALGFLLVPECFSIAIQLLCFDSIWQQGEHFLCAPSLGSTAGSRPSLPVSKQVSCYLSLWISSCEHDPVMGTELPNWVCMFQIQRDILINTVNTGISLSAGQAWNWLPWQQMQLSAPVVISGTAQQLWKQVRACLV